MSKIICDVCGTSYQETATQCPICGCVRSGEPVTVSGDTNDMQVSPVITYTHVRGGRFSKANVKKRNAGMSVYSAEAAAKPVKKKTAPEKTEGKQTQKVDKILVAAVIVLLLAITAVVIYIACSFMGITLPFGNTEPTGNNTAPTTVPPTETTAPTETTEDTVPQVPCEGLELSDTVVEFETVGDFLNLEVTASPENQTDDIIFISEDDSVAAVDDNGRVEAIGPGQTVVHVTCGEYEATCRVVCTFQPETTTPTEPDETTAPTVPDVTYSMDTFKLNREDFTIGTSHSPWKLYDGEIPVELIEWSSEDSDIATFEDGVVVPVSEGVTTVYATYNGVTLECIVRVY